jgi:aspartate/methionine/tyrosine aminotransferase
MSVNVSVPSDRIAQGLLRRRTETALRNRKLIEDGRRVVREWAEGTQAVRYTEPVAHLCFPALQADTLSLADRLLKEHSTFLAPGESFGLPRHFRLNIGLGVEQLEGGLAQVTKALG